MSQASEAFSREHKERLFATIRSGIRWNIDGLPRQEALSRELKEREEQINQCLVGRTIEKVSLSRMDSQVYLSEIVLSGGVTLCDDGLTFRWQEDPAAGILSLRG